MVKIKDIKQCIADKLVIPFDQLKPKARLIEDLGADSLDLVELAMELENRFNFTEDRAKDKLHMEYASKGANYWGQWKTVKDVCDGVRFICR